MGKWLRGRSRERIDYQLPSSILQWLPGFFMKNKIFSITSITLIILALYGCQNSPQKNVAAVVNTKCAPMHNLSQEKRKACTGQSSLNQNGYDSKVSEAVDKNSLTKS